MTEFTIRFTWGNADHLNGFNGYRVQATSVDGAPPSEDPVLDLTRRQATYTGLEPGVLYQLSVNVLFQDNVNNILWTENQRTSEYTVTSLHSWKIYFSQNVFVELGLIYFVNMGQ